MQQNPQQRKPRSQRHAQPGGEPVRRAQYPDEAPRASYPEYPTYPTAPSAPSSSAPPSPYQQSAPYQQNAPYQRPNGFYQQPAQYTAPYYGPRFEQNAARTPYPPQNAPDTWQQQPPAEPPRRRSHDGVWLLVIIVCIALLTAGGFAVSALYSANYPAFRQKVQAMSESTFYYGVHVDNVHIGGLTMSEARRALEQNAAASNEQFSLSVTIDGKTWRITQNELPLSRNIDAVLSEAYAIGRQGSLDTLNASITPFEARCQQADFVHQKGAYLYTEITYDKTRARELADTLANSVSIAASDASIYSFDFSTRSFQFIPEQVGQEISSEEIYNAIIANMDARNYNGSISLNTRTVTPSVTVAALSQNYGLISSYSTSTETLTGYNRTKNIELSCAAISGKVVQPGETFSFNEATGKRTVEKGYLPAGAIAQGASIEETGGGVCQTSSTLFNAVALAGMEIVKLSPHAWPSTYVDPARDATVDWQSWQTLSESTDFVFRNSSDYPIFIVAYLTGSNYNRACTCTVEIYGVALSDGVEIALSVNLISTTPAPTETEYVLNTSLAYGTEKVTRKARTGYKYETWRIYYLNGVEINREKLRTATYRPYAQKIEYNY